MTSSDLLITASQGNPSGGVGARKRRPGYDRGKLAQAALGQRRVEVQHEVEQLGGALRCRERFGQRVRELVDFDALVATRDA